MPATAKKNQTFPLVDFSKASCALALLLEQKLKKLYNDKSPPALKSVAGSFP